MSLEDARATVERACEQFQVLLPPAACSTTSSFSSRQTGTTETVFFICLQHPATQAQAEQVLLQFRRSPGVLPACRHILEHSASAEARFHAACALREAVLREWASLPAEERTALRTYVLQYVLHHADEPQLQVVRSILQGTLAVMLKRGWMDADEQARAAFFQVRMLSAVLRRHTGRGMQAGQAGRPMGFFQRQGHLCLRCHTTPSISSPQSMLVGVSSTGC